MDQERLARNVTIGAALLFVVIGVVVGMVAHSWGVGLLVGAAPMVSFLGALFVDEDQKVVAWIGVFAGLAMLGGAMWMSAMAGRWLWALPLLLTGVVIGVRGLDLHGGPYSRSGDTLAAIGALCIAFAVIGPLLVYGSFEPSTAAPAAPVVSAPSVALDWGGVLGGIGAFGRRVLTSVWGWANILLLVLVGRSWGKRWGIPAALAAALVLAAVTMAVGAEANATFSRAFASSPPDVMREVMNASVRAWGSAGWGLALFGIALGLVLARTMRAAVRAAAQMRSGGRSWMSPVAPDEMSEAVGDMPGYMAGQVVLLAVGGVVTFVLWAALRGYPPLPFDAIAIPDLTVPHFRPVWQLAYFGPPALVGISALLANLAMRRRGALVEIPVFGNPVWQLVWPFALGLFVPSGVMVLGATFGLAVGATVMPGGRVRSRTKVPEPEIETDRGPWFDPGEPRPTPKTNELDSDLLLDAGPSAVDVVRTGDGDLVALTREGAIAWRDGSGRGAARSTRVVNPLGLAPREGNGVVFVEGAGRLQEIAPSGGEAVVLRSVATEPFDIFGASPDGALVALGSRSAAGLRAYFVLGDVVRRLSSEPETVLAVAVALDGRSVAAAGPDGTVGVYAVGAESRSATLEPAGEGGVERLAARTSGGWAVAYGDKTVAVFGSAGGCEGTARMTAAVTALAVCARTGRVAIGARTGYVRVRSADLDSKLAEGRVHNSEVVRLAFHDRELEALFADGEYRRVEL